MAADLHHVRQDLHSLWNILKASPGGSTPWKCSNLAKAALDDLDAIMRAPPLAAPAPSATTGDDELARVRESWIAARQVVFAVRAVLEAFGDRDEPHIDDHQSAALRELRETATAYDQRNHDRGTPPAAPASVTDAQRENAVRAVRIQFGERSASPEEVVDMVIAALAAGQGAT